MKNELKAKFLQNLVSKKQGNEGFTLIELLVVIMIIGILSAAALPSFLNQVSKTRAAEAKTNIGAIHRAQQVFRLESPTFAGGSTGLNELNAKISGKFYSYILGPGSSLSGSLTTTSTGLTAELKQYSGAVAQNSSTDFFSQVICEANATNTSVVPGTPPTVAGGASTCPSASNVVQ